MYGILDDPKLKKMAEFLVEDIHEITYNIVMDEAEKLARFVKEEINAQPPDWPPLSTAYRAYKERVGLNTDMLKATEAYWNAIAIQETRNNKGQFASAMSLGTGTAFSVRVGLPFKKHPGLQETTEDNDTNLRYDELAAILEYGTEHIPARPHWGPAYRRWKSQHARSIKARITSIAVRRFNAHLKGLGKAKKIHKL